jgi:hypothetical protein
MQLPNLNIGMYSPRFARPRQLERVNELTVDTSPLSRPEGLYVPQSPNQIAGAVWVSAVLNTYHIKNAAIEFLTQNEQDFFTYERSPKDLYSTVEIFNRKAAPYSWSYSLTRVNSWVDLLLALVEGCTVMVGGSVYESFYKAEISGIVPMPKPGEALLGGQIINMISFDQKEDTGQAIGNMGRDVGRRGLFTYRGSYLRNLQICGDFFVLVPRYEHAN